MHSGNQFHYLNSLAQIARPNQILCYRCSQDPSPSVGTQATVYESAMPSLLRVKKTGSVIPNASIIVNYFDRGFHYAKP
jgi:hypothetical protein